MKPDARGGRRLKPEAQGTGRRRGLSVWAAWHQHPCTKFASHRASERNHTPESPFARKRHRGLGHRAILSTSTHVPRCENPRTPGLRRPGSSRVPDHHPDLGFPGKQTPRPRLSFPRPEAGGSGTCWIRTQSQLLLLTIGKCTGHVCPVGAPRGHVRPAQVSGWLTGLALNPRVPVRTSLSPRVGLNQQESPHAPGFLLFFC